MRFKLDENLPEAASEWLAAAGHDVHTVRDEGLAGAIDDVVLQAAITEQRVLVTLDLDFSDIRRHPPGSHAGLWVLRPARQTWRAIEALLQSALRLTDHEAVHGQLWVVDERQVRIRDAGT